MWQPQNFPVQVDPPAGIGDLLFERMSATERLSEPFFYELSVLSTKRDIGADKVLGHPVQVSVEMPAGGKRTFHGLVTRFVRTGQQNTGTTDAARLLYRYQLRLQPWLWFLSRTADCRVFQKKSVTDIFKAVVQGHGFTDYRLSVNASYPPLEYCVQYRETDLNFLSRLLEDAGIWYYFEHKDNKHVMVLGDDTATHATAQGYEKVRFAQGLGGRAMVDAIESWWVEHLVQPGAYATTDYNFETPHTSLLKSTAKSRPYAHSDLEIFDFPATPTDLTAGAVDAVAKVRLAEAQTEYERFHGGASHCAGLRTGSKFSLTDHPDDDLARDYVIVATEHTMVSNAYSSAAAEPFSMAVAVQAIDADSTFRPPRTTPRPVIQGAQTALVVGKSGEEIDVDKYGRVKVQFPWDRYGKKDENSSCWVRVAQVWAGKNWGAMHIPRIGQEVLVSFLEGDPDRPIITGRVYNADMMPPYELPANATQSGIKSRSSKGGSSSNFNELRFEDKKGSELVYLQAEKDYQSLVKNDETTEVKNDRTDTVGGKETVTIKKDQSTTIQGQETRKVSKDRTTNIDGNDQQTIASGKNYTIDVGAKYSLTATDEIALKTGQSTLTMKKDGTIELKGMTITIEGSQSVTVKGNVGVTVQVSSTSVKLDPASLNLAGTMIAVKGQAQTQVQGAMVQVSGQAMTQISGGVIMIG